MDTIWMDTIIVEPEHTTTIGPVVFGNKTKQSVVINWEKRTENNIRIYLIGAVGKLH